MKDSIDTADKMMTTAGSLALEGNVAPRDADVVKKLRDAGAVLGKTNMSEWGYMRSTRPCNGSVNWGVLPTTGLPVGMSFFAGAFQEGGQPYPGVSPDGLQMISPKGAGP